ncbi:non-homologous end-joining factor 1-like [Lycorma delicatula]|uniref:non-homologous end-joining factor 1-like n=1 Tax=Lycorma delicatula TaxID=130591 RepID=UPI003F514524
MWKRIMIDDKDFIIRTSVTENKYDILLSDFSKVWSEILTEEQILERCKEMNPLYEAEPVILIKRIFELIDPKQLQIKKELLKTGNQLTLNFISYLKGIIFKFQFILTLTTPEKLCQHLTFPLIQMIEELQAREKMLFNLLAKKDAEINEYKMEGAKISRQSVITEPFNEQKFLENCSTNGESRSLKNLQFPFLYFEESCAELYEECAKRKKVFEEALTPKKKVMKEEKLTDVKTTVKPETSKSKKANEIIYDEEVSNFYNRIQYLIQHIKTPILTS